MAVEINYWLIPGKIMVQSSCSFVLKKKIIINKRLIHKSLNYFATSAGQVTTELKK